MPDSSRVADSINTPLLGTSQAMIKEAWVIQKYLREAVNHAAHFYYRTILQILNMKSLFESFIGKVSKLSKLKVFGCYVYVHLRKANRTSKLHDHAESGISLQMNGAHYRIILLTCRQVIFTKNVTFDVEFVPVIPGKLENFTLIDDQDHDVEEMWRHSHWDEIRGHCTLEAGESGLLITKYEESTGTCRATLVGMTSTTMRVACKEDTCHSKWGGRSDLRSFPSPSLKWERAHGAFSDV